MKRLLILGFTIASVLFLESCSSDEDPQPSNLVANDLTVSVSEGASNGDVLGSIVATTDGGSLTFEIANQTPAGAVSVGNTTGEVIVADASLFVFAANPQIVVAVNVSNGVENQQISVTININEPVVSDFNIWTGATITFTKDDGTDPTLEENQDRITDNVWITRATNGGQIFNIKVEDSSTKSDSPSDTEWAVGTSSNIANLQFLPFRDAVTPKNVVGQDLVLHLITDDIYIDIKFTAWSQGGQNGGRGGFAYERSTEN